MLSQTDTVLVTGANGFVGSAVVRALLRREARVRVLVRPTSDRANLDGLDVDVRDGDVRDESAVRRATRGVRCVFHVAADYRLWAPDPQEIGLNNRLGTAAVMNAARAAGVERVVYTSSVATLKPDPAGPADETRPATPEQAVGVYKRSKVEAERLVEAMVADGLPAVIVNPSTPLGPWDRRPTPTGRLVLEAAAGRMPVFVHSGLNFVHVDDVAEGHLLALERGRVGERYVLGGQDVPLRRLLTDIAAITGRRPPLFGMARWPLFPFAWANQKLARRTGREPFLTVDGLRMAAHHMYFTSAKAQAELGYRARPYTEALAEQIGWFRVAGMLA